MKAEIALSALSKKIKIIFACVLFLCTAIDGASRKKVNKNNKKGMDMAVMKVISNAFKDGEMIPAKYTCDGEDVSPQISWQDAPTGTKSFVLICDDPDAPMGIWVHWVVFNIPVSVTEFAQGADPKKIGATEGINSWGTKKLGFGGPCPPSNTHRYYFTVYAVSKIIDLDKKATKEDVLAAIKGHELAQGQLMGRYHRK